MANDWRAERRVAEAVRAHRPLSAADRRVAQDLLDRSDRRRWVPLLYAVAAVAWVVLALVLTGLPLVAALGVLFVVAGVLHWVLVIRRVRHDSAAQGLVPRRLRPHPTVRSAAR